MESCIISFLEGQRVATICCVDEDAKPYCFNCFYAFDKERELIYFKTSPNTKHTELIIRRPDVAGTIQPDKLNPLALKGIQFNGVIVDSEHIVTNASNFYHKKYPFALAMPGKVYTIQPRFIKMTDNTLSFGKKIIWQRDKAEEIKRA